VPEPAAYPGSTPAALGLAGSGGSEAGGYLKAGLRATRAVAAAPGPAESYKTVLPVLHSELQALVARLWLREIGGEHLVCVDWSWSEPRYQEAAEPPFGITCAPGEGLAGECWIARKVMALPMGSRPDLFPNLGQLQSAGIETMIGVPLPGIADIVGVLTLYYAPGSARTAAELEQLALLGAALGAVIEAKQQDAAAREQLRRDQLLLRATSAVASATGYQETLRMLAASSVPWLADLCLIDLLTRQGTLERVAAVHADPGQAMLVDELERYYAPRVGSPHPADEVTATGRSIWAAEMTDEFLRDTTRDERHYEIVRSLGFTSYLSVPLRAEDEILGAITLISAGSGRRFTEEDVATGERLATQVAGTIAKARDLEREQQRSAKVAVRTQALLELGAELSGAQGIEEVLDALMRSPACSLGATVARIALLDEPRGMLRLTFSESVQPELASRYHLIGMDSPVPIVDVVGEARRMLIPDTKRLGGHYRELIADTSQFVRSVALEPLLAADGTPLGALGLSWPEPHAFGAEDVELLSAVGATLSRAVARILVARREHEVAVALQERLLALEAGSRAAVVSGAYRPAGGEMRVGGDWYTARVLDGHAIGVSVGDVVGHGLAAVTTMSQLRSALEAVAIGQTDPAGILTLLDRYARGVPGALCATATYAGVDWPPGRVHYACAGHPYPVVVHPDGEVQFLTEGRSAPLGIEPPEPMAGASGVAELPPGSLFVLYSDGLIERHGESLHEGLERLGDAVTHCRQLSVGAVCTELMGSLATEPGYSDDVVVVALRPVGTREDCHVDCFPARFQEIAPARHRLRAWLRALGLEETRRYELLVAAGEAVNNAIEHGGGQDPRRFVSVEAFADDLRVEISVTDSGRWSKDSSVSRRTDERGRGLTLIHGLSEQVDTVRGPLGTRVTMTFLRQPQPAEDGQASGVSSSWSRSSSTD
jgi:GAF domain-containing protein/anti-sigma regulatory factor (Ser/Thr protein kinase)